LVSSNWMDPRGSLEVVAKREIFTPAKNGIHDCPGHSPVNTLSELFYLSKCVFVLNIIQQIKKFPKFWTLVTKTLGGGGVFICHRDHAYY
jgi:hypothetical protein